MNHTIYKMAGRCDPFARIPHTLLEDEKLSWRAKGILCYLCGKPDGWKTRALDIRNHGKEGVVAVRAALKELRVAGYAELVRITESGKVKEWVWKVSDTPLFKKPDDRKPHLVSPHLETCHRSKKEGSKKDFSENETEETEETLASPSVWKPSALSKAEQLRQIRAPKNYPSERQFDAFLDDEELFNIVTYRSDLYSTLCDQKWHRWLKKCLKWSPIRDWKAYVKALHSKINSESTF